MKRRDPMWNMIADSFKYALRSAVGPAGLGLSEAEQHRIEREVDLAALFEYCKDLEARISELRSRMEIMENSTWVPWWLRKCKHSR